jgi:hypothetical protein
MLEWALDFGWDAQRFFFALQEALAQGSVLDRDGLLTTP